MIGRAMYHMIAIGRNQRVGVEMLKRNRNGKRDVCAACFSC